MLYLAGKIIVFLVLAAILGFILGWYLRQILTNKNAPDLQVNDSKNLKDIKTLEIENEELKIKLDKCLESSKNIQNKMSLSQKTEKDNLQKIRGIGNVLELKLNQLGIYTFKQISEWDKSDVEKISKKIGPFRDRIARDNWITQAKKLLEN